MERLLGEDLDDVRLHTDLAAAVAARSIGAAAFTAGSHVGFDTGAFRPHSAPGQRLLAHELAHVIQQRNGPVAATPAPGGIALSHPSDPFERHAEQVAERLGAGHAPSEQAAIDNRVITPVSEAGPLPVVQRAPTTIVQTGEMTGDQFQVAAALLDDPELHLYLITGEHPSSRDKGRAIFDFYVNLTGIDRSRLHLETNADPSKLKTQIFKAMRDPQWGHPAASVGEATNRLRTGFKEKPGPQDGLAATVRNAWLGSSQWSERDTQEFVLRKNIPLDRPLVVLWSRQSGKMGGLHPDLDSSYQGLADLAGLFLAKGYGVLIAGDDPKRKIAGNDSGERFAGAVRLGEFWRDEAFAGKPRTAQFAFFEHLRQVAPTVTHIGMRSGNLEAYAYMGHRVLFIEERDRSDATRMNKLVDLNLSLKYRTVKLEELPTNTGQALIGNPAQVVDDEAKLKPRTETPEARQRYAYRDKVQSEIDTVKRWARLAEQASKPNAKTHDKDFASLPEDAQRDARDWLELQKEIKGTATHTMRMREVQWIKKRRPDLKARRRGFGASGATIVAATEERFWHVSIPESELGGFFKRRGERQENARWVGKDDENYLFTRMWEERERKGSEQEGVYLVKTMMFEFVRQPSPSRLNRRNRQRAHSAPVLPTRV